MRVIIASLFSIALVGATAGTDQQEVEATPFEAETVISERAEPLDPRGEECRDRIVHARDALGQPPLLRREPASPERPLAIYAVDRTQDGCSVLVMMGDPDDIRPMPEPEQGPIFRQLPVNQKR